MQGTGEWSHRTNVAVKGVLAAALPGKVGLVVVRVSGGTLQAFLKNPFRAVPLPACGLSGAGFREGLRGLL